MEHDGWIPALHRDLTDGAESVKVSGETMGEIVAVLEEQFPGFEKRLCENGRIRPHISVAIDGIITHRGLRQRLKNPSEIHFVPALGGGSP